jgi:hypothetical protein
LPELGIDDCLVLAWINFALMGDFAAIEVVLQKRIEGAARALSH